MKRKNILKNVLLAGIIPFALSCSNEFTEGYTGAGNEETGVEETEQPQLSITVSTPAPEGVIYTRAEQIQDSEESAINTLNVYLFKSDTDQKQGSDDTHYKFFSKTTFKKSGAESGKELTPSGQNTTCSMPIDPTLFAQYVKIVLIANDDPISPEQTKDNTTLEQFKQALATAVVTANKESDVLVGGDSKSFPMSVVVTDAQLMTPAGADISATLVRSMARIDIFNNTPNLTITNVVLTNTNNKSYLLGGDPVNVPGDASKISLTPLKEYQTLLTSGIAYDDCKEDEEAEEEEGEEEEEFEPHVLAEPSADDIKKANCHRAFYLYEQTVTDEESSPVVTITYTVKVNDNTTLNGSVDVLFKKNGSEYVNVKRNNLYTIQLGDGKVLTAGKVTTQFVVDDWTVTDIESGLNPGSEGK